MKYILASVLAFTLMAGISISSYAQSDDAPTKIEQPEKPAKKERKRMRGSKSYSRMLNKVILRASEVVREDSKKAELTKIRDEVVFPMVKEENNIKSARMEILKSLTTADFDQGAVMKEFKKNQAAQTKLFKQYVKALEQIKTVVGDENYNAIFAERMGKNKKPKAGDQKKAEEKGSEEAPEKK